MPESSSSPLRDVRAAACPPRPRGAGRRAAAARRSAAGRGVERTGCGAASGSGDGRVDASWRSAPVARRRALAGGAAGRERRHATAHASSRARPTTAASGRGGQRGRPTATRAASSGSASSSGSRSDARAAPRVGAAQQVVGEARALGEHRAVQVGADDVVAHGALGAVLAVVAAARLGAAERAHARAERGEPAVVLVADEPPGVGGVDVVVADEPYVLAVGDDVEHARRRRCGGPRG